VNHVHSSHRTGGGNSRIGPVGCTWSAGWRKNRRGRLASACALVQKNLGEKFLKESGYDREPLRDLSLYDTQGDLNRDFRGGRSGGSGKGRRDSVSTRRTQRLWHHLGERDHRKDILRCMGRREFRGGLRVIAYCQLWAKKETRRKEGLGIKVDR